MVEICFDHFLIRITYHYKSKFVKHIDIALYLKQDRKKGVKFRMTKRYNKYEFLIYSVFMKGTTKRYNEYEFLIDSVFIEAKNIQYVFKEKYNSSSVCC